MGSRSRGAFLVALLLEAAPVPIPSPHQPDADVKHVQVRGETGHRDDQGSGKSGEECAQAKHENEHGESGQERCGSDQPKLEDKRPHEVRVEPTPTFKVQGSHRPAAPLMSAGPAAQVIPTPAPSTAPAPAQSPVPTPAAPPAAARAVARPAAAVPSPLSLRPVGSGEVVAVPAQAPAAPVPRVRNNPAMAGFPEVVIPPGPEGRRIEVALFALPLLVAIWLWAAVRAGLAAWARRGAAVRGAIASQLGLRTDQLAALDPEGLRRLRDGIAFDELTGVLRRAAGLASLERELARAARSGQPLSVAFIDVDGLKQANDTLGHAAGDALLRGVAGVLTRRLRAQDLVFRYGGDEFVCVMPDTPRPRAESIAEEMRRMAGTLGLRFSFGAAQAGPGESARAVIDRADSLQYLDKQARKASR
jgi:diguanylate cyclase (GGDEF)-like protein